MRRCHWLALLLLAAACTPDHPFDKPGTWRLPESGANEANLRAMVVNPKDLEAGAGESNSLGPEAAPPVKRLLTGHRAPLPAVTASQVGGAAATQAAPAAGGGNAGE